MSNRSERYLACCHFSLNADLAAMSAFGPKRTCATEQLASADRSEADIQCEHHPRQLMTQSGHGVSRFVFSITARLRIATPMMLSACSWISR